MASPTTTTTAPGAFSSDDGETASSSYDGSSSSSSSSSDGEEQQVHLESPHVECGHDDAAADPSPVRSLLSQLHCDNSIQFTSTTSSSSSLSGGVLSIRADESAKKALRLLRKNRIQSVVVLEANAGAKVLGTFSTIHVVAQVLRLLPYKDIVEATAEAGESHHTHIKERIAAVGAMLRRSTQNKSKGDGPSSAHSSSSSSSRRRKTAHAVDEAAHTFGKMTVAEVLELVSAEGVELVDEKSSLADAVQRMVDKGAHRVISVAADGKLTNFITQSRVLQLVAPVAATRVPRFQKTIAELDIGVKAGKGLVSVAGSAPVYEAFEQIVTKRISGVAVVRDNLLIGTLSASDIKLLGSDLRRWNLLRLSCEGFIEALTQKSKKEGGTNIRKGVISDIFEEPAEFVVSVRESDSLRTVIKRIGQYKLHRIFVTKDDGATLTRVISLRDILAEALKEDV